MDMIEFIRKRPWLLVVLLFVVVISKWVYVAHLGRTYGPQPIPDAPGRPAPTAKTAPAAPDS